MNWRETLRPLASSCILLGGAAVGAGATGAAYEARSRHELDSDFSAGRIDREEYLARKREIEKRSVLY